MFRWSRKCRQRAFSAALVWSALRKGSPMPAAARNGRMPSRRTRPHLQEWQKVTNESNTLNQAITVSLRCLRCFRMMHLNSRKSSLPPASSALCVPGQRLPHNAIC